MTITDISAAGETRSDGTPRVPDERQRYIDGLLMLAGILKNHPGVPLPYHGHHCEITISEFLCVADPREALAAAARAFPCDWRKGARDDTYFDLIGQLGGLKIKLTAYRDAVCERVVVGTEDRPVEKVITPAVTETVTEPTEIVEWRCGSLLAPRTAELADKAQKAVA